MIEIVSVVAAFIAGAVISALCLLVLMERAVPGIRKAAVAEHERKTRIRVMLGPRVRQDISLAELRALGVLAGRNGLTVDLGGGICSGGES